VYLMGLSVISHCHVGSRENGYDLCMEDCLAFCFFSVPSVFLFLPMVFGVLAGLTMSPVCFRSGVLDVSSFCFDISNCLAWQASRYPLF
jgi:hypothetical protein